MAQLVQSAHKDPKVKLASVDLKDLRALEDQLVLPDLNTNQSMKSPSTSNTRPSLIITRAPNLDRRLDLTQKSPIP